MIQVGLGQGCAALEQLVVNNDNNKVTSTEAGLEISVKWLKENYPSWFVEEGNQSKE